MLPDAPVEGRVLLVDGDSLAYACAGNDETLPGEARLKLLDRLASAMRASGSTSCRILLTDPASDKGKRYAIATVKPYQGNRDSSHKPKNWSFLRDYLERPSAIVGEGYRFEVAPTVAAEADDLFGALVSELGWENCVLYVPDKDLRMVPGLHLHWSEHYITRVPEGAFEVIGKDGKVYGEKWFWLQMLQGDEADYVPGLPLYVEAGKQKKVGPKTAEKLLADTGCRSDAGSRVFDLYTSYYGDAAGLQMAEQAVLLWMRRDPHGDWWDVFREGNPLNRLRAYVLPLLERVARVA